MSGPHLSRRDPSRRRRFRRRPPAGIAIGAFAAAVTLGAGFAYRDGPPPAHTGAFGEPDCGACHFDAARDGDGRVAIAVPAAYEPGRTYDIEVTLEHPELEAAGFQLSTRFASGSRAGEQAGELAAPSERTRVQAGDNGVLYASHTAAGANPEQPGSARWTVRWTAPPARHDVAFDVAANAANDDVSEFGDRLLLRREVVQPVSEK